ncbi:LCP family protein [Desulfosporosinus sp. SRJS8]|nr:LCP family protein [Desulfosporosinus sp. SRJS8]MCB8814584.1 LCP family protein [Desulfosporosinus sp. SRJS8]
MKILAKKRDKKKKLKRVFIILALLIAGLLVGRAAFAVFYFGEEGLFADRQTDGSADLNNRVSFLLIGTDKRPGENSYNADSIIVASLDPKTKLISLLSIPRDTRVTLSGSKSYYKINAVPMLKGIPELEKQVTGLTGIKLNGYVLTNFAGFKDIIDTLGGITIDVEKDMQHVTGDKEDGYINLKAGVQELDGSKALQYARYRDNTTADIGRTARQQKVLTTAGKKMLEPATILKLPKLVPQLMKTVETDLSLKDLLTLAGAAKSFDDATIVTQTLPGDAIMLDGLSYWEVNRDKAKEVAGNLLLGQTADDIWDSSVLASLDPEVKARLAAPAREEAIDIPEIPGVIAPEEGATPVTTIQTEQYAGTITWSPVDAIFFAGQEYMATITLLPKAGYTLKGVTEDFFTAPGASTTRNAAGSGVITAVFPVSPSEPAQPTEPSELAEPTEPTESTEPATTISLSKIRGVIPPESEVSPVTTISETEQYTGTITWSPADDPFVEGRDYTAIITLVPKEGYTLAGIGENYFKVPGAAAANPAGTGVVTAVFPREDEDLPGTE